jgi:hypothetical protein
MLALALRADSTVEAAVAASAGRHGGSLSAQPVALRDRAASSSVLATGVR